MGRAPAVFQVKTQFPPSVAVYEKIKELKQHWSQQGKITHQSTIR